MPRAAVKAPATRQAKRAPKAKAATKAPKTKTSRKSAKSKSSSSKKSRRSTRSSKAAPKSRPSIDPNGAVEELARRSEQLEAAPARSSTRPSRKRPRDEEVNVSVARKTRVFEKKELQNLNQRLETLLLKQREREKLLSNTQQALDNQKDTLESDMEATREAYQQQLDSIRLQRDDHHKARTQLEKQNLELEQDLLAAGKRLELEKTAREDLDRELEDARKEADEITARMRQNEDALKTAKSRVHDLEVELERAQAELETVSDENQVLRQSTSVDDEQLRRGSEDMQLVVKKAVAEKEVLERKLTEARDKLAAAEKAMGFGFDDHVAELLAAKQEEWNKEKDEMMSELKSVYEQRIEAFKRQLEDAGHRAAILKEQIDSLEGEVDEAVHRAEKIAAERDDFRQKIKVLENQLQAARERPNKELEAKTRLVKQMKVAYQRKEKEFDDLMDVKIALAMEIKAYRRLLEQEEKRLGYGPRKKRRLNDGAAASTDELVGPDEDAEGESDDDVEGGGHLPDATASESQLVLSGSMGGRYLTVRNQSTENVSLSGWLVRNRAHSHSFELPEGRTLEPGDLLKVWIGQPDDQVDDGISEDDVVWESDEPVWDIEHGDEARLVDPAGEVVHSYVVVPGANRDPNKSCVVM